VGILSVIAVVLAVLWISAFSAADNSERDNPLSVARLTANESGMVDVVKDGVCDYKIVYSATDTVYDGDLAQVHHWM
jgi:hypothetical protein